jgi:hypothetical protein
MLHRIETLVKMLCEKKQKTLPELATQISEIFHAQSQQIIFFFPTFVTLLVVVL